MFEVKIEDNGALAGLARMEQATHNATPLARSISNEFLSQTEANLEAEGRPQWLGLILPQSRRAARTAHGREDHAGERQLAASFTQDTALTARGLAVIRSMRPFSTLAGHQQASTE